MMWLEDKMMNAILDASALWAFYIQNKVLSLIFLGLLLGGTSYLFFYFRRRRKKKDDKKVIPPVTDLIGSDEERVAELNKDLEPFGFAYDPTQDIFYSNMYCWQREFGYCKLYDDAAIAFSMVIDCEPVKFEYNGYTWMIEFCKGQYGMTTGGEVGIYYTKGPKVNIPGFFTGTFYHTVKDEDRINMSFAFRKNGNLLFTRSGYHWWLTGFKLGEFSQPSELTMDIILDLYDRQMANAFVEALVKLGYTDEEYAIRGRRVYVHFSKPRSPQPYTRNSLTTLIMQKNNRSLCEAYQYLTSEYSDTLDKLVIVKNESPNMYRHILSVGKPKEVFEPYFKIKSYIKNQDAD